MPLPQTLDKLWEVDLSKTWKMSWSKTWKVLLRRRVFFGWLIAWAGAGCKPSPRPPRAFDLMGPPLGSLWQPAGIPDEGRVEVTPDRLVLHAGQPMTGARFTGDWEALGLPWIRYALEFEARRVEGRDFFATCTFPVGSADRCVSLVLGGWGGGLVGISSIDYFDASENSTRGELPFENGRWYRVRIEVRDDDLRAWIDDRPVVNTSIKGRHLSLRGGDIEHCAPLGFASWFTHGEVRGVRLERLGGS